MVIFDISLIRGEILINSFIIRKTVIIPLCLIVLSLIFFNFKLVRAEEPEITFSTTTIRPGDFFLVKVKTIPESTVTFKLQNQSKQLSWLESEGSYIGMMALSYRTKPGEYPGQIEVTNSQRMVVIAQNILVENRKFVEERIRVPEKKRKAILTPQNRNNDNQRTAEVREKAEQKKLPPLWEGPFVLPVTGRKTAEFGLIRYVNDIENGRHSGWDIAAPNGTPVKAINKGEVIFAGNLYITGNTVILHHGLDFYSSYAHLSKITVKEGETITKGQVIGNVGSTGLSTGPHLHLTIRVGDIPVDPALILDKTIEWSSSTSEESQPVQ